MRVCVCMLTSGRELLGSSYWEVNFEWQSFDEYQKIVKNLSIFSPIKILHHTVLYMFIVFCVGGSKGKSVLYFP